jgi:hypothetical protein
MYQAGSFLKNRRGIAALLIFSIGLFPLVARAGAASIKGQDVNGRAVAVNGTGHYTVVLYTNPDLEDASRKMTLALDSFRSRSDFSLIRVVDLRGDVPLDMRGIVRGQIRKEMAKEDLRLKTQRGISDASAHAPIIPDFSGSTLDALGWDSVYSQIHLVVYDRDGREIKRLANVSDARELTRIVAGIL